MNESITVYPTIDMFYADMAQQGYFTSSEAELRYKANKFCEELEERARTEQEFGALRCLEHFGAVVGVGDSHWAAGSIVDTLRRLKLTRGLSELGEEVLSLAEELYNEAQDR